MKTRFLSLRAEKLVLSWGQLTWLWLTEYGGKTQSLGPAQCGWEAKGYISSVGKRTRNKCPPCQGLQGKLPISNLGAKSTEKNKKQTNKTSWKFAAEKKSRKSSLQNLVHSCPAVEVPPGSWQKLLHIFSEGTHLQLRHQWILTSKVLKKIRRMQSKWNRW